MDTVEFEIIPEDELAEIVGGKLDVYRALGMCGCGLQHD
ncbi:MAG TPA: bacteriocin [Mycobacteriales bacterium]|nr:bacteriocin [Mycobacteriales bacterium]